MLNILLKIYRNEHPSIVRWVSFPNMAKLKYAIEYISKYPDVNEVVIDEIYESKVSMRKDSLNYLKNEVL